MGESPLSDWPAGNRTVFLLESGEQLAWGRLAGGIRSFADALPDHSQIVNLCQSPRSFLVSLLAIALTGKTALLPSERTARAMRNLADGFPGIAAIADTPDDAELARAVDIPVTAFVPPEGVEASFGGSEWRTVCGASIIQFTSGSTGRPEPNRKTIGYLREGARGNAAAMIEGLPAPPVIVATVPPYHMYGLESTVALPLFANCSVYDGRPFYPSDIVAALESVPRPRLLVSTPAHLRILVESGSTLPTVDRIFSATSPLPESLGEMLERLTGGEVREIYGTTESGIVGCRRIVSERAFRPVGKMSLTPEEDGALVTAPHMEKPVKLFDRMAIDAEGRFSIAGRSNDIVNIAGKRMSLSGMNAILAEVEGVMDGAFLAPPDDAEGPVRRTVAFVVARGVDEAGIRAALKGALDPAFLPRRILFVDALPRNAAGKLPIGDFRRLALARLLDDFQAERTVDFPAGDPFFAGHFPGAPIVPGAVLLDEAGSLLDEGLCGLNIGTEIVSAKFPASAGPGIPCRFQAVTAGDGRIRVEGVQKGRTVMRAVFGASNDGADV